MSPPPHRRRRTSVPTFDQTVAANLRDYRRLRQLTQHGLATRMRQLGHRTWSNVTVSEIERSRRRISASERLSLAAALGVSPLDLDDPVSQHEPSSGTVQVGNVIMPVEILKPWLRGTVRVSFMGPKHIQLDEVPGYEADYQAATNARDKIRFLE
jgi:transcriptional regulator with XRE-family HTH domain